MSHTTYFTLLETLQTSGNPVSNVKRRILHLLLFQVLSISAFLVIPHEYMYNLRRKIYAFTIFLGERSWPSG